MNTSFFIAKRYLFSKKSTNVINIISGISVVGIAVSVMSMIIILSAINGLESLVDVLSSKFDADIRITPSEGKSFNRKEFDFGFVKNQKGIQAYSETVEELCIVKYGDRFVHAMLKGVEPSFFEVSNVGSHLEDGDTVLKEDEFYFCMVDVSIAAGLELYVNPRPGEYESVTLFAPIRNKKIKINNDPFNRQTILLSGVFNVDSDDELKPVLVHRDLAAAMLEYGDDISAVEIKVSDPAQANRIKNQLQEHYGSDFKVKTRYEQNELLYKVSQSEKYFILAMLSFVLLLTGFNILASLTMLVMDKKNDIAVLKSMGADKRFIRSVFFGEGMMINFFGAFSGMILGSVIVLTQYYFHVVQLEGAVIDHYPVQLNAMDFIWIFGIVVLVGASCSYFPVRYLVKKHF